MNTKKKILAALILTIAAMLLLLTSCGGGDSIVYELNEDNGSYTLKSAKLTSTQKDFVIPDLHKGLPVTGVASCAFSNDKHLRSITIGENVTNIEKKAFEYCPNFMSISVSESNPKYTVIQNCLVEKGTTKLVLGCGGSTIPTDGSINTIGEYAFYGCYALNKIVIPKEIKSIEKYAMEGCMNLKVIYIEDMPSAPQGAFSFGYRASVYMKSDVNPQSWFKDWNSDWSDIFYKDVSGFYSEGGISYALIEGSKTAIVADHEIDIKNATIPASVNGYAVTTIAKGAFDRCSNLESISLPQSLESICTSAFEKCTSLKSIVIPENVRSIGNFAFYECKSLDSISLPSGLVEIRSFAFSDCVSLKKIVLPLSLSKVGDYVFDECMKLTIYAESPGEPTNWSEYWNDYGCNVVWGHKE